MNLLRLIFLLAICCFLGAARELPVIPAQHPEQIGGRWETVTPSGIEGVGFEIFSQSNGVSRSGGENFVLQQVNVRVYTREGRKEKWGYFAAQYRPKRETDILPDPTSFDVFDGRRLRMHFTDPTDDRPAQSLSVHSFDLDIVFLPKANKWIGTWSQDGKTQCVTLSRPEASEGTEPNKFVGEWIGQSSSDNLDRSTSINICQSSDGVLSVWLDDPSSGYQRNGYQMNIESKSDTTIVFRTNNSSGATYEFRGSLSADGQTLTGKWGTLSEWRGTPSEVWQFHKVQAPRQSSSR